MSRFIILEDRMINVDHIVEVVDHDDGVVTICLTNSEMIPAIRSSVAIMLYPSSPAAPTSGRE